jgi:lysophospholipase L1-like esterase
VTSPRPRTVWLAVVGALLVLAVAAVLLVPRPVADGSAVTAHTSSSPAPTRAATASAPLRMLGFGDSVMAGAGCDCDEFLVRVGAGLHARTRRTVVTDNNGANGETASGLLQDLQTDDAQQGEIARADVIVVTIGANDLTPALDAWDDGGCDRSCYQPRIDDMADRLSAILTTVNDHKQPATPVLVTNYWNVFEDGDVGAGDYGQGYLAWSDTVTKSANTAICRAARLGEATCVDTYAPFKADGGKDPTGLLADDGDHPNDAGTAVIASAVLTAAESRLRG